TRSFVAPPQTSNQQAYREFPVIQRLMVTAMLINLAAPLICIRLADQTAASNTFNCSRGRSSIRLERLSRSERLKALYSISAPAAFLRALAEAVILPLRRQRPAGASPASGVGR